MSPPVDNPKAHQRIALLQPNIMRMILFSILLEEYSWPIFRHIYYYRCFIMRKLFAMIFLEVAFEFLKGSDRKQK